MRREQRKVGSLQGSNPARSRGKLAVSRDQTQLGVEESRQSLGIKPSQEQSWPSLGVKPIHLTQQNVILEVHKLSECLHMQQERIHVRTGDQSKSMQLQQKPIVRAKLLNRTKNRTLVTCMLSNINILRSLRSLCYYSQYWRVILPCFDFYIHVHVVTHSYSSRPFLCTLDVVMV